MPITLTNSSWDHSTLKFNWSWSYIDSKAKFLLFTVKSGTSNAVLMSGTLDNSINSGQGLFTQPLSSGESSVKVILELYDSTITGARSGSVVIAQTFTVIVSTPNPDSSWTTSSFGTDIKLVDNQLTGSVIINKTNNFDSLKNYEPLNLWTQIKVNGIVTSVKSYGFVFGTNSQINISVTDMINYTTATLEIYVWDLNLNVYSTVQTKILTNQITPIIVTVPTSPTLSKTSSGVGLIHLSWTGANPVDIERADSINSYSVLISSLSTNSIDYDLGISANTYFFRVRSQNSAGYSNYSNVITFEVVGSTPPPPTGTVPNPPIIESSTYSITDSNIVNVLISWVPVTNSTSYNIEYQASGYSNYISYGDNNYNDVGNGKIGFSAPISGSNGNYLFRVRAKNSIGYSNYSNVLVVTKNIDYPDPVLTVPDPPVFTMIDSQDPLSKLLRWNQVIGLTTYNIESSSPITDPLWISFGGDFEVGELNDIGSLWAIKVVKGIQNGLWKYRIRAKNSIGYSNYSNVVSYTISDPSIPISDKKSILHKVMGFTAMLGALSLLTAKR